MDIIQQDLIALFDEWREAHHNGVQFPVPFEAAWRVVEYSTKANGKRGLKSLKRDVQFSLDLMKTPGGGRSSELIKLSIGGFTHFCLMADTKAGKEIRDYFIDAEEKWRLAKQLSPALAEEIEVLKLKQDIARLEAQKAVAEEKTISLRHLITTTMPTAIADRVLGVTAVKEIEYRDRIFSNGQLVRLGDTFNKTKLCERYGITTKKGTPDYRKLNIELANADLPEEAWEVTETLQTNRELKAEYLDILDQRLFQGQRQLRLGEM
jgi:phage anti-repressor protein